MLIPDLWVIAKDPHDSVLEVDALLDILIDASGFNKLRNGAEGFISVLNNAIYPSAFLGVEESDFEMTKATGLVQIIVNMTGRGKQVGCLLIDRFKLIGHFKNPN